MKPLPERPTFAQLQHYVTEMEQARNLHTSSLEEQCLKFIEEVGEVAKAVRKHQALSVDPTSTIGNLGDELADVLIYVCAIANRCDVDLTQAFHDHQKGYRRSGPNRPDTAEPTLADVQHLVLEPRTDERDLIDECLLLSQPVSAVCIAARTWRVASPSARRGVAAGLVSVLRHLAVIANRADLDLSTALRAKERINETRVWIKPSLRPAAS